MNGTWYCLLVGIICLLACSPEKKPEQQAKVVNPHEAVFPHVESERTAAGALSQQDRQKLKAAAGRQAEALHIEGLNRMLDSLGGMLHMLNFWSLDCRDCLVQNAMLEEAQAQLGDSVLWINHINVDDLERTPDINASIRAQGLVNPCQILQTDSLYNWSNWVQVNWDGSLPAFVLVNQEEGIRLFYQKTCSSEEFLALLQPFTL